VGFVVDKLALGQVFPCQFHSTGAPLLGKGQKIIIIIIIFIIGLHNKPHGCSASVASAAGPFTTKKKVLTYNLFYSTKYQSSEKIKVAAPRVLAALHYFLRTLVGLLGMDYYTKDWNTQYFFVGALTSLLSLTSSTYEWFSRKLLASPNCGWKGPTLPPSRRTDQ
jgi:hypothetical protein